LGVLGIEVSCRGRQEDCIFQKEEENVLLRIEGNQLRIESQKCWLLWVEGTDKGIKEAKGGFER